MTWQEIFAIYNSQDKDRLSSLLCLKTELIPILGRTRYEACIKQLRNSIAERENDINCAGGAE